MSSTPFHTASSAVPLPLAGAKLVVIAASAGGLQALGTLLGSIQKSFPAPIAVVMHRGAGEPERLRGILQRLTSLQVRNAVEGEPFEAGVVYLCPPGTHMTAVHAVHLSDAPRLKHVRPSADLMLDSAARSFGAGAIAVVLSGSGRDAALGTVVVSRHGGTVLVQEPSTCGFSGMPDAAIAQGCVDGIVPLEELGVALGKLVRDPVVVALALPSEPVIRLLLVDDHRIILDALRSLLDREEDMRVIAEAEDGVNAVRLAAEFTPSVVLMMDVLMPGLSGMEATRQIKAQNASVGVVALSSRHDSTSAELALQAGAHSYLQKNASSSELLAAIRSAARSDANGSNATARAPGAVADRGPLDRPDSTLESHRLTVGEREVLQWLVEGVARERIAYRLQLDADSLHAVETRILHKLGIDSAASPAR